MKKICALLLLAGCFVTAQSQLVIQQGAAINATGDVTIIVDNMDVINQDPATNLVAGVLICKGTIPTILEGAGNWRLKRLVVNKTGESLNLGADLQILEKVQLVSGLLDLFGKTITLLQGARLEGETESTRITGPSGGVVQATAPLFAPSSTNLGNLGATISSNMNLGNVTVKRRHDIAFAELKIQRHYDISAENNAAINATVRLGYLDAELNGLTESALHIYTRNAAAAPWTSIGSSSRNSTINYVEKIGINSLQHYAIGDPGSALPLRWGPVLVACAGDQSKISWTTLQEQNVREFVVESINGGSNWSGAGTVTATGNSNSTKTYSFNNSSSSAQLYRIRSVDIDGTQHFSPVVRFAGCGVAMSMTIYPIPAKDNATLSINTSQAFTGTLRIVANDGRLHSRQPLAAGAGTSVVNLSVKNLAAGMYHVLLETPDGVLKTKLVKD